MQCCPPPILGRTTPKLSLQGNGGHLWYPNWVSCFPLKTYFFVPTYVLPWKAWGSHTPKGVWKCSFCSAAPPAPHLLSLAMASSLHLGRTALPLCPRALPWGILVGGYLEKPGTKWWPDPVPWRGLKEAACTSCGMLAQRVVEGTWWDASICWGCLNLWPTLTLPTSFSLPLHWPFFSGPCACSMLCMLWAALISLNGLQRFSQSSHTFGITILYPWPVPFRDLQSLTGFPYGTLSSLLTVLLPLTVQTPPASCFSKKHAHARKKKHFSLSQDQTGHGSWPCSPPWQSPPNQVS